MKKTCIVRSLGRKISAWLLAFVMIVSVISVPAKAAENEPETESVINLISEPETKNGTTEKDAYAPEEEPSYIVTDAFTLTNELKAAAADGRMVRLDVNVTVNSHEFTTEDAEVLIYSMDNNYTWVPSESSTVSEGETYNLSLDLTSFTSINEMGLRFKTGVDNGVNVNYTINSAKVVLGEATVELETIAELVEADTEVVEAEVVKNSDGDDYHTEYMFTISDEVKNAVAGDGTLRLDVTVTVDSLVSETADTKPFIMLYAQDGNWGNWKDATTIVTGFGEACTVSLDLSSYSSLNALAMRIVGCAEGSTVNYTINSAKVVGVLDDEEEKEDFSDVAVGDVIAQLISSPDSRESVTVDNQWGNDYIVDYPFNVPQRVKDAAEAGVPLKLNVTVSIQSHELKTGSPEAVIYAQDNNNGWLQNQQAILEEKSTYELSLNLSSYESIASLGFRFATYDEGAVISYTIESAEVVVGVAPVVDPNAKATLADPGTTKTGKVVQNQYGPDKIVDNAFTVPHDLTFGLGGFTSLALEVGVTVNDYTPDESVKDKPQTGDVPNGAKVVIYAQDSKYAIWEQEYEMLEETPQTVDLKLDLSTFINDGTLGALGLRIVDCVEGTTVDYTINYAKVTGEGESLAVADIIDLKYELTGEKKEIAPEDTEVSKHGKLSLETVEGYSAPIIVDKNGEPYQLRGASSHGLSWFPGYVNKDAYQTFRDEWGMNMVRIAVYAREGDYAYVDDCEAQKVSDDDAKAYNDEIIQKGVEAATELGMYVIIDWHVLRYNPNNDLEESTAFFEKYATMYKDYDNVIFEICNEPTETAWYDGSGKDIYTYGTELTKAIRDCGSDALIICGTPSFSAEVDDVAEKPLEDKNTLYACHFYAASHYDDAQKKFTDALAAGVPVFISEFGICTASGDGMYDPDNTDKWLDICDENNVSYACWATSNSTESAAYFKSDCWKYDGAWTEDEITTTGKYLINRYRDRQALLDKQAVCEHTKTEIRNKKTATCKKEGYTGDTYCKDCDKKLKAGKAESKLTTHAMTEVRNKKAATCKEEGYTGDTYCKVCDKIVSVGKVETKLTTHSWDEGKVTKEPTAKEKGEILYTCKICNTTKKEELTATGAPAKGEKLTDNSNKAQYKVTKSGLTGGTVEYVKPVDQTAKTVKIPATITVDGIKYNVTSIAKNAFENNSKIKEVTIGSNIKTIGDKAFYKCKNLKTVTIGKNVKTIGDKAFYKCTKLKAITIKTTKLTKKNVGSNAFKGIDSKATIKVPKSKVNSYKTLLKSKGVSSKAKIKK